jgi:CheY-like chemotaxis protein
MIEVGLELDGYDVLTAEGGQQAIDLIKTHEVDLVISDIRMPGMNGVETITRLRELVPRVPVIVATGFLAPETVEECRELGRVEVMRKPFAFQKLTSAVETALAAG